MSVGGDRELDRARADEHRGQRDHARAPGRGRSEDEADQEKRHEGPQGGRRRRQDREDQLARHQHEGERRDDQRRVKDHLARAVAEQIERHADRLHEVDHDAPVVQFVVQQTRLIDVEDQTHQQRNGRVRDDRVQRHAVRCRVARIERHPDDPQEVHPHRERRDAREDLEAIGRFACDRFEGELIVRLDDGEHQNSSAASSTGGWW